MLIDCHECERTWTDKDDYARHVVREHHDRLTEDGEVPGVDGVVITGDSPGEDRETVAADGGEVDDL